MRAAIDEGVVSEYAAVLEAGRELPPVIVFHDGRDYWLADGFHRFRAYGSALRKHLFAEVHQGTQRDAILHACGANDTHGLRRSRQDRRRAVETLLSDEEWQRWSDREIARRCAVSDWLVRKLREVMEGPQGERICANTQIGSPGEQRKVSRKGTTYLMDVDDINEARSQRLIDKAMAALPPERRLRLLAEEEAEAAEAKGKATATAPAAERRRKCLHCGGKGWIE